MKTAQEPTNPAQVTVRTTTTRQIPAESLPSDRKAPEFWEYIEKLRPEDWERHLLYIYRRNSETGPTVPCEKSSGMMTLPDNTQVPLSNREEFEFALQKKYGGGTYRLILKRGSERVTEGRITIDGPPKAISFASDTAPTIGPVMNDGATAADVAKTAMQLVGSKEAEAINVGVNALRGASEVIQRLASAQGHSAQPNETDMLLRQAMVAMMQRALNPPDPMEQITKLMGFIQTMNGGAGGSGSGAPYSAIVQRIIDSTLERALNPTPAGPVTSASAELVRQFPQIASYAAEAIREWRIGTEAQRDAAIAMSGRPALPPAANQPGQTPAMPAPAAAAPAPGAQQPMGAPSLEWIESKIIEILNEPENTPAEAADETIELLSRLSPVMLTQLTSLGEAGALQLFEMRPALKPALQNLARLREFIKAFFKYAQEAQSAAVAGANGAATPPPGMPN